MSKIIVGLGEVLWDVFPNRSVLGGAPANFAYNANQLGYDSYIVSAVGNDELGEKALSLLDERGLSYVINKVDYPTGSVGVELNDKGVPNFTIHEGVAWDNIPFTDELKELASKTDTVSFGTLAQRCNTSNDTIKQFLNAMPENSHKVFDINLRQHFYSKEVIEDSLRLSTMLKLNEDEVLVIADLFGYKETDEKVLCKDLLHKYDLELVILTKGTDGSYIITKDEVSFQPTQKVEVIDTVGAGDSFTAAFIVSYMNGKSLQEAHKTAVEVSAFICTQHGAMTIIPQKFRDKVK